MTHYEQKQQYINSWTPGLNTKQRESLRKFVQEHQQSKIITKGI